MRCFMIVTVRNGGIDMRIITISREFGSGGRTIGKQTAEMLGIRYYDKELVKEVAVQTGFEESFVEEEGEHAPAKNWISYALAINGRNGGGMSANDFLWSIQRKVILEIAEQEPCVIVGRCADYILGDNPNNLNIFIYAPYEDRLVNCVNELGMDTKQAKKMISEVDKARGAFHLRYAKYKPNDMDHMDIMVNSAMLGVKGTAEYLCDLVRKKFEL